MGSHPSKWRFTVAAVSYVLTCSDEQSLDAVRSLLRRHLAVDDSAPTSPDAVQLRVERSTVQRPAHLEPVHLADHIGVWKNDEMFWLEAGDSSANVEPDGGIAHFTLGPRFFHLPGNSQRDLLLTPMMMLVRHRGIYMLHGSGAERDGRGVLAVGRSGSGKTTTALSMIANGWRFLGDDMVALHVGTERCVTRAFRRSVSTDHVELARFGFADPPYPDDTGGTTPFDTDVHPERTIDAFEPDLLLLPTVTNAHTTQVQSLSPVEALADIGSAMGGIMTHPVWAKRQLDAAAALSQQAACYRLFLGRDVYDQPTLLPDVLIKESVL